MGENDVYKEAEARKVALLSDAESLRDTFSRSGSVAGSVVNSRSSSPPTLPASSVSGDSNSNGIDIGVESTRVLMIGADGSDNGNGDEELQISPSNAELGPALGPTAT